VFLRKRVHKVMKTKGRRCKKVQGVRILLRTLQIARIAETKRFWEHGYTSTPCFAKKRLESVENKGLGVKNSEKRGCILLKTLRGSLQRKCKRRHLGRLRRESRGRMAGRARNGIQDGNLMTGLL
jgi:hypothetical protein